MKSAGVRSVLGALFFCLGLASCQRDTQGPVPEEKPKGDTGLAVDQKTTKHRHVAPLYVDMRSAAFSPDNKYVLTGFGGGKKLLTLWEVATGKEIRSLAGHKDMVVGVAFVAGGKRALSGSVDGRLLLHDLRTGKLIQALKPYPGNISFLAASPDGKLALTSGPEAEGVGVLKLWDTADGLKLLRAFGGPGMMGPGLAISPDHKWALSSAPPRLWDLGSGKLRAALEPKLWGGGVAAFSPDSRLALVSHARGFNKGHSLWQTGVWEVATGKIRCFLDGEGSLVAQFTPGGKSIVGFAGETGHGVWIGFFIGPLKFNLWDRASGKVLRSVTFPRPKEEQIHVLVFSPDGRLAFMSAGGVYEGPWGKERPRPAEMILAIWDLENGQVVRQWTRPPADAEP